MAQLPNGKHAVIPMEKLVGYCLNPTYARGKEKARVFASFLVSLKTMPLNLHLSFVRQLSLEK